MRIKLLNNGGYGGMGNINFPVEVEAVKWNGGFEVSTSELIRVGCDPDCLYDGGTLFFAPGEFKAVSYD